MTTWNDNQLKWNREAIQDLSRAYMESRILLTGVELDLFTLVATTWLTAKQITEYLKADLRALTILLDALTAMGLLLKQDDAYRCEPSAAQLLAKDGPDSVLPNILHNADLWNQWSQLTDRRQRGQANYDLTISWKHFILIL
jgi:hypothetical protein